MRGCMPRCAVIATQFTIASIFAQCHLGRLPTYARIGPNLTDNFSIDEYLVRRLRRCCRCQERHDHRAGLTASASGAVQITCVSCLSSCGEGQYLVISRALAWSGGCAHLCSWRFNSSCFEVEPPWVFSKS